MEKRNRPGNPVLPTLSNILSFAEKYNKMAKRYSEEEKRKIVTSYLESGQSRAAYSRVCGVSAITLKSWQSRYIEANPAGFVAISAPEHESGYSFRLRLGEAELEFDRLPPLEWVCSFLKSMSR